MSAPLTPTVVHVPLPPPPPTPLKLKLGGLTGVYPWTGGKPIDSTFSNMQQTQPYSPYCYHLQNPTKTHKQMAVKISINCHGETDAKQFTKDEKDLSLMISSTNLMNI